MSYTLILDSKARANPDGSVYDATYNFDWSVFEEGKYKLTWNIAPRFVPSRFTYDVIDPTGLFWYYPFNTVTSNRISNYASGAAVNDAVVNTNSTIANNRLITGIPATTPVGVTVNNAVPCSASPGITFSFWFMATAFAAGAYPIFIMLRSVGNNQYYIALNANTNQFLFNGSVNNAVCALNTPYHVVVTIVNSGTTGYQIVYLNGGIISTGNVVYPSFENASGQNSIGSSVTAGQAGNIGWMQEFRLYNRVITAAEVAVLYAAGYWA